MQIKELAERARMPVHMVRYYTKVGLLRPYRDPNNRYRNYAESDIYRARFIRRAKWLGFLLRDVEAIFRDVDRGVSPCSEVRETIENRAKQNHRRFKELSHIQAYVDETVALWQAMHDRAPHHDSWRRLINAVAQADGDLT